MKTINLRGTEIGTGIPKMIVPIVDHTADAIVAKATVLKGTALHMVEWRADFYEDVMDTESILNVLSGLRTTLGEIPLLFTFRTKNEGGEQSIAKDAYTIMNKTVAESGFVDAVDVEVFFGDAVAQENIKNIHRAGVIVIGSNHDFNKTPDYSDLLYRLRKMQDIGVDIPKIAVMPTSKADVITLLSATQEMYTKYADRPFITMSMSGDGVISRLCGEVFGSSMTFGAVGQVSAPGQIPVEQLNTVMKVLHNAMYV